MNLRAIRQVIQILHLALLFVPRLSNVLGAIHSLEARNSIVCALVPTKAGLP